jgi:hypothetical protein
MGQKVECKGRSVIGLEFALMEENSLFLNTDLNLGPLEHKVYVVLLTQLL